MVELELRLLKPECLQEGKPMRSKIIHTTELSTRRTVEDGAKNKWVIRNMYTQLELRSALPQTVQPGRRQDVSGELE